jgi:iron(III) transport system ATP-binding protein
MTGRAKSTAVHSPSYGDTGGVSVAGLTKVYGPSPGLVALDDFTLDFPAGKCTVLLGPSGCGKTTVLRSIAGLVTPNTGRITIADSLVFDAESRTNTPPEKRRLGMVFQSYALWPHLTVAENIAYPLSTSGLSKSNIMSEARSMLEWVGLGGMGGRFVHELSGGQQQRVSLCRAMVGRPRAILFDEPLSNLDARLRERMRMELLALRQQAPLTSIYVTHDQLEAMTLGDRVVVMRAGMIEQEGAPEEVYKRPRTRFVADFVGIPNLVEGTINRCDASGTVVDTVIGALQARGWRRDRPAGSLCTVAIRPTLLELHAGDRPDARTGRIIRSVFQGASSIHIVDMEGTQITVESLKEVRHEPETVVNLAPAPGAVFALLDD